MRSRARDYRTLDGLTSDREAIAWYWRVLAFTASCMILGGFLILPSTFDTDAKLRVTKAVLGIFSVVLLTVGFALTGLVCFACRNYIFRVDCVYLPCLTSCTIGLLTVFYSFIISGRYVWNIASLLTTVGSGVSILVYATLLVLTQRKVTAVRKNTDSVGLIDNPGPISPGLPYHDPSFFANHQANMYPTARPPSNEPMIPTDQLSEEDLMRQQMLMLLNNKPEPSISTESVANTFNRIDFTPIDEPEPSNLIPTTGLPDNRGYYGYYAPGAPTAPSHGSQLSRPTNSLQPWDGVWRGEARPAQVFDTARREERRREIEQGR